MKFTRQDLKDLAAIAAACLGLVFVALGLAKLIEFIARVVSS